MTDDVSFAYCEVAEEDETQSATFSEWGSPNSCGMFRRLSGNRHRLSTVFLWLASSIF